MTQIGKIVKLSIRMLNVRSINTHRHWSAGLAFLLLLGLSTIFPNSTWAAVLSFSPTNQTVPLGQTMSAMVYLNTDGEQVNRVLARITYPSSVLTPQSIDTTGSSFTLWYQQNTTNSGTIILEGGASGSGVNGSQLTVARINFTTKEVGNALLNFSTDSAVYKESDGTNVLSTTQSATYTVGSSTPTPSQGTTPGAPTSTPTPTSGTTTSTPTPGPGTPTVTPNPNVTGTITPTPTNLPSSGSIQPTIIFLVGTVVIFLIGFLVLKKS